MSVKWDCWLVPHLDAEIGRKLGYGDRFISHLPGRPKVFNDLFNDTVRAQGLESESNGVGWPLFSEGLGGIPRRAH